MLFSSMEVNLCPSSASCSVDVTEYVQSLSKPENQAIVHLEHSVTAVCPENGEVKFTTIIPDQNIECGKNIGVLGEECYNTKGLNHTSLSTAAHSVNNIGEIHNGNKLLFRNNAGFRSQPYTTHNDRTSVPGRDICNTEIVGNHSTESLCDQSVHNRSKRTLIEFKNNDYHIADSTNSKGESSGSRKRKKPNEWDSGNEDVKKPRKNKQWSRTNMKDAIMAVQNGMRLRRAAKNFEVPRSTLKYKLASIRTLPVSTDWSEDINENLKLIGDHERNQWYENSREVNITIPAQEIQLKNQINVDTEQKNSDSKDKSSMVSPSNDSPAIQHNRSLRSNSGLPDNESTQISLVMQSTQTSWTRELNKRNKETRVLGSNQKIDKTNKSCDEDLRCKSEQKVIKIPEIEKMKHFKLWSQEAMNKAISAVENGSNLSEASIKFGIPRSTLRRRVAPSCKKAQVLTRNEFQTNISEVQGIRQSLRRRKKTSAPDAAPKDLEIQSTSSTPNLSLKDEAKDVGKNGIVDTPENGRDDIRESKDRRMKVKKWSEETMKKALEAIDQGMSVSSTAKKFNLPHASLKTRKYKRDCMNTKCVGPEPHISPEDEGHIVDYVNDCATFGIVNVKEVVLLLIAEAAEKKLIWDIKKQGLPSDEWWDSFCSRRGSHIRNVDIIQPNQHVKITEARLSLFYDKLSAIKNSSQYHNTPLANCSECRTFTVQEFKYNLDAVTEWINDGNQGEAGACKRPETDLENNLVSTICCGSAAGNSFPPMFVYHTESNYKIPATGLVGPFGAAHFVHKVQDLTRKSDFYFKWFEEIFLKYAPQARPLIVLFDPDTAFITPEFIQLAHKNKIILLGLPPFSAHFTQPLNNTVFPALKKGFTFTSSLFKRIFLKGVNFNNFARCFKVAWNSSVDAAIIKTGFAETGIHPLDRKVLLKST